MGRGQFDTNATRRPDIYRESLNRQLPYGITIGFVFGALAGVKIATTSFNGGNRRIPMRCSETEKPGWLAGRDKCYTKGLEFYHAPSSDRQILIAARITSPLSAHENDVLQVRATISHFASRWLS